MSQDMKSIFDEKLALKGGPGSGPRPGQKNRLGTGTASGIRSDVQNSLGSKADAARKDGAMTYVSSSSSPNLTGGDRHFIDIKHSMQSVEDKHSNLAQEHLNKVASRIREYNRSAMTYVSSMTSPNMGTRTFMDVKLPDKKKSLSFKSLAEGIEARVDELKSQADLLGAITQLEESLIIAETNEPINRSEGNTAQADLEVEHAASFNRALGLLRAGKSLPDDLFERVSENLSLYVKGGPGSGPREGQQNRLGTGFSRGDVVTPASLKEAGFKFERTSGMTSSVYKHPTLGKISVKVDDKGRPIRIIAVQGDGRARSRTPFVKLDRGGYD